VHQQAILAIQRTATTSGPEYWLVRFGPEAAR